MDQENENLSDDINENQPVSVMSNLLIRDADTKKVLLNQQGTAKNFQEDSDGTYC